jgi:hypothetical protein
VIVLSKNDDAYSKVLVGFRRFVHDILPIAIARLGLDIEPPAVDVAIVPDQYWMKLPENVPCLENFEKTWTDVKAVAVYIPLSFENRLRVMVELQRTDPAGNYDRQVDYDSVIFLRKTELVEGQEERTVIEFYASMAAACFGLVITAATGDYGVCPISNPFRDTNATAAMETLTRSMTPSEFVKRYAPED